MEKRQELCDAPERESIDCETFLHCAGCGKVIGKVANATIVIRHKGRSVSFPIFQNGGAVEICCETCKTKNFF